MEVKIHRLRNVPLPRYHTDGAAAFDLAIAEAVTIKSGQTVLAPTGLVIASPPGTMLMVVPRSSTRKRYGLALGNTVGIIDSDYCGPEDEIKLALTKVGDPESGATDTIIIPAGTRLAQGIIVPIVIAEWDEVEFETMPTSRGGYGSTGV